MTKDRWFVIYDDCIVDECFSKKEALDTQQYYPQIHSIIMSEKTMSKLYYVYDDLKIPKGVQDA